MNIYQVIVSPVISEKSVSGQEQDKYSFLVHAEATKDDVKKAIAEIYAVKVKDVNMGRRPGKTRLVRRGQEAQKRQPRKKAIVTLEKGEVLDPGKVYADFKTKDKK